MSALTKGFKIVDYVVSMHQQGVIFSEIVAATGLPKASVHRLLRELCEIGVLTYDMDAKKYHGGLVLAQFGGRIIDQFDLRRQMQGPLDALHARTGHVTTLGIRNEDIGVYIDKREAADYGVKMHSAVGKTFPLHCTAMGKVLLAHAPSALVTRLLRRKLEVYTENTITDPDQLRAQLEQVRREGFALDDEEITRGLVCVAVPVRGADGAIAGAMSCTMPSWLAEEQGTDATLVALREYAGP